MFLFRLMNEKIRMSMKAHLLSFCYATSHTFESFQIMLNLIYIHINVHMYIYMCT